MYLIIALISVLISAYFFRIAAGTLKLTNLNLITWIFYYVFLSQALISSLLVVYNLDFHYLINRIGKPEARTMGFYSIQYMIIAVPLGMIMASKIFSFRAEKVFFNYQRAPLRPFLSKNDSYIRLPLYLLSIISFLSILYTFYTIRSFPILKMLSGADAITLGNLRTSAKGGFEGLSIIRNVFGITLTPILCYVSYGYYKLTGNINDRIWFVIMAILSVLILTYNLEKAPVGFFLIGFFFFKVYYDGKVNIKTLLYFGLILLGLILLLYSFLSTSSGGSLFDIRSGFLGRIFLGQSAGVYLTFDTFPNPFNYLGFSTLSENITSLLQIENQERLGSILIQRYNPNSVDLGTAGVINTFFIAEAWANFGLVGLIIAPIYVGFLIQIMYILFLKSPKTPLILGLFVYYSYKGAIGGGFNEYIYNPGLLITFSLILFVYTYGVSLKKSFN